MFGFKLGAVQHALTGLLLKTSAGNPQTIYICSISRNFFMILSVCTAVGGSLLAFRDAINPRACGRRLQEEPDEGEGSVCSFSRDHLFEMTSGRSWARCSNGTSQMDIKT